MLAKRGRVGGREVRGLGINTYTLLCLKWMTNKDRSAAQELCSVLPAQQAEMERNLKKDIYYSLYK